MKNVESAAVRITSSKYTRAVAGRTENPGGPGRGQAEFLFPRKVVPKLDERSASGRRGLGLLDADA